MTIVLMPVPLHLSFYAAEVLLFRALMHPATRTARAATDSNLRRWFPIALADFQTFTAFVENISIQDLQGFWIRRKSSSLDPDCFPLFSHFKVASLPRYPLRNPQPMLFLDPRQT